VLNFESSALLSLYKVNLVAKMFIFVCVDMCAMVFVSVACFCLYLFPVFTFSWMHAGEPVGIHICTHTCAHTDRLTD